MPDAVRIEPLDPAQFTPEQAELVGAWTHLNFSRVIVRHPEMYRIFVPWIEQLIARTKLPPRDREVVVIRVLALSDETYEAKHHADIAAKVGMSPAEIAAAGADGQGLPDWDRLLMRAADELVRSGKLTDAAWALLAERYSEVQLMDLVFLVGCYNTMAMLTRSFGIELEDDPGVDERLKQLRQYT